MEKLVIQNKAVKESLSKNNKNVYNFINANTLWWIKNSSIYYELIKGKCNLNFIDGRVLSFILSVKQNRGPSFTKSFLISTIAKKKKHFFIGLEEIDKKNLSDKTKIPIKNIYSYNPSYIKEIEFSSEERKKIVSLLKKEKPSFVWVCVGSPKQEVLSNQLFDFYKSNYFNIGAALDFMLGKKEEAPKIFQKLGLEWFYRLVTDFKYSKRKVWRSFLGLIYLLFRKIKIYSA